VLLRQVLGRQRRAKIAVPGLDQLQRPLPLRVGNLAVRRPPPQPVHHPGVALLADPGKQLSYPSFAEP